ncbi:hypothetical protein GCM10008956_39080 [Deinococcus arenae]|uniref:Uncharacterized protein n=1 Tax=Deinococcus arenae TaxID=1452751 RepID=A0A8H9LDB7_9DEIO|nr:hypothetical protein [Deinococcus arenae]GGM59592.1 hypothetical protein GCM10008956_39080 [Deinococcus arenae]
MKQWMYVAALVLASTAGAQVNLDQPQSWNVQFLLRMMDAGDGLRSLTLYPREDVALEDTLKAASGKATAVLGKVAGIREEMLYQPTVFWRPCPYPALKSTLLDATAQSMNRAGYTLVTKKTSADEQVGLWRAKDKKAPDVATVITLKCGGDSAGQLDKSVMVLSAFQVGSTKHLAYGKVMSDRVLGVLTPQAADNRIQLRTPTGPVRPTSGGNILVELYNSTGTALSVVLRVDVRDSAGRVINSYSESAGVVKANSPKQTVVPFAAVGGVDAIVTVESVR